MLNRKDALGQFEFLVLTAILQLREHASGLAITKRVSALGGRKVMSGSVYITLGRMERKGYVSSFIADPTSPYGDNPRRYFRLLAPGEKALKEAAETAKKLVEAVAESEPRWRPN
jgi:DNA-binding PadR family transcriptional regulator